MFVSKISADSFFHVFSKNTYFCSLHRLITIYIHYTIYFLYAIYRGPNHQNKLKPFLKPLRGPGRTVSSQRHRWGLHMLDTALMTTSRHIKQSNVLWSKRLNSKRRLDATPGVRFYWDADPATRMRSLRSAVLRRVIYYVWIRCTEIERWWGGKRKSYGNRFFSSPYGRDAEAAATVGRLAFRRECASAPVGNPFLRGRSGARAFLRRPYISIFIALRHSAFIYFILPLRRRR